MDDSEFMYKSQRAHCLSNDDGKVFLANATWFHLCAALASSSGVVNPELENIYQCPHAAPAAVVHDDP